MALCCNELAASLLTVIKSAQCPTGKELSSQVQSLSHNIARAGKSVNHLLKKRGVSTSRRSSRTPHPPLNAVAVKLAATAVDCAERRDSLTVAHEKTVADEKVSVSVEEVGPSVEVHDSQSRNSATDPAATISTAEHGSADHEANTSIVSAKATKTESDRTLSEQSAERSTVTEDTIVDGRAGKTATPTEETVSVRHSNATGQVISESPTHSPPHQTTNLSSTGTGIGNGISGKPCAIALVATGGQTVSNEEDFPII